MLLDCAYTINWGDVPTWLTFGVTAIYAWITYYIWQNTKETLQHSIDAQNRTTQLFLALNDAHVGVLKIELKKVKSAASEDVYGVNIIFKNFGSAPARQLEATGSIGLSEDIKNHRVESPDYKGVLFPGQTVRSLASTGKAIYEQAQTGEARLYIRTDVSYTGLNNQKREFYTLAAFYAKGNYFEIIESRLR